MPTINLLATHNAGVEGVTVLPNGEILVAAEREPRGLIQFSPEPSSSVARAWRMDDAACPAPWKRPNDFADLTVFGGLERGEHAWREGAAWSYGAVENDPMYAYADRRFGLAEGLAVDAEHVYIVLDNNGDSRASSAKDKRPLLFIFRSPLAPQPD